MSKGKDDMLLSSERTLKDNRHKRTLAPELGDRATPVNNVTKTPLLSLWDCSQFPCTSGVGAPPFPFNTGMALRIAGDSVEYSNDSLDYRWWARKSLYRSLALHDTVLGQDTALRNFFDNYEKNDALVQFDHLRLRVSDFLYGKPKEGYNTLSSDLEAVTTDGLQEENMKNYLLSYLQFQHGDEPDTALSHIWSIATQCVFKGGPSVLEARSFLTLDSLELINYEWNDSCGGGGGGGSKMDDNSTTEKPENHQQKLVKALNYKLIPNLFKDNKTAIITLGSDEEGYVEIYNATGSKVEIYYVSGGNNLLDLNKLTRGIFIYKVFVNEMFKNNDKLIVLE